MFVLRHVYFTILALFASASTAFGQTVLIDNASGSQVQSIQMSAVGEAYAQPFSVGATAQAINAISVRLTNTAGAPYDVRFALWSDNGGSPNQKLAESDVISELGTVLGSQRSKSWPGIPEPILAANDTYWLSVELVSGAMGWDFKGTTDNPGGTGGILLAGNRISTDRGETWPGDYSEGGVAMIRMVGSEATSAVVTSVLDSGAGSLRDAIVEANTIAGPSAIWFDPALSGQTIRLDGTELTLSSELSIDASNLPDGIILSGDRTDDGHTADDSRVFRIEFGAEVYLDSLIITEGRSPNGEEGLFGERNGGGGISNEGTLTMRRCTLAGNTGGPGRDGDAGGDGNGRAAPDGGGIANYNTATIEECTISHNLTGAGGNAALDFRNGGESGYGAGIFNQGTLTIRNSTVTGNLCGSGGAGLNGGNPGRGGGGGGLYSPGTLVVESCTIIDNKAADANQTGFGGDGGGILWQGGSANSFTIENTIVALNQAGVAGSGGGTAGKGPDLRRTFGSNPPARAGVNFIGDNTDTDEFFAEGFPNPNGDLVGTGASPIDPDLGPFEDNGGMTLTFLPQSFSPVADPPNGLEVAPFPIDQRGEPRLTGIRMDIGAIEAPDYAGIRAALAARKSQLTRTIRTLNKKAKIAKRKGQTRKVRSLKKKIRQLTRTLNSL